MDERYDAEALRLARQAVMAGETVLWAGRPGRRWTPGWDVARPAVLLGVVAVAFGGIVLNEPGRINHAWQWFVPVVFGALPAIQLAFAIRAIRRRDREVYAVTDGRVLILGPDGAVRHGVGLGRSGEFRRVGRTVSLGGEDEALRLGKGDLDGGLRRFELLPRLERLADAEQVMATIRRAAARYAA